MKSVQKFKKNQMKTYLFIAALSICNMSVKAQTKPGSAPVPTYMMPEGTLISKDKIDSVRKVTFATSISPDIKHDLSTAINADL
jgi:hypothetical protein